jgi:hypothetical protein
MNPYVAVILSNLSSIVAAFVIALIPFAVRWLFSFLEKRFQLKVDEADQKRLSDLLNAGIAHAEEWKNGKLKMKEDAPSGAQMLEKASKFVAAEITRNKLPELAADKLNDLVIAKLGQNRADAAQPGLSLIPNATGTATATATATAAPTEPAKG